MHHVLHALVLQILRYLLKNIINRQQEKKKSKKHQHTPEELCWKIAGMFQNHSVSSTEVFSLQRIVDYRLRGTFPISDLNAWKS